MRSYLSRWRSFRWRGPNALGIRYGGVQTTVSAKTRSASVGGTADRVGNPLLPVIPSSCNHGRRAHTRRCPFTTRHRDVAFLVTFVGFFPTSPKELLWPPPPHSPRLTMACSPGFRAQIARTYSKSGARSISSSERRLATPTSAFVSSIFRPRATYR